MGCKSEKKVKEEPRYRKGLWSPEEDFKLRNYVLKHGHDRWSSVPINAGLQRNGKSCRLRWINYLRPGLKRGMFSSQEEEIIVSLHSSLGNKWSQIAQQLPGRTDNEIKNYWHTYLKKKVQKLQEHEATNKACNIAATSSLNSDNISNDFISLQVESQNINTTSIGINDHNYVPHIEANKNILPNVAFAEWLLNDSFVTNFSDYGSKLAINNCFNGHDAFEEHITNLQDDDLFNNEEVINSSLISDESAGNGYENTNSSSVSYRSTGIMITSQFTFTDQSALGNDHVHDFGSSDFIFLQ